MDLRIKMRTLERELQEKTHTIMAMNKELALLRKALELERQYGKKAMVMAIMSANLRKARPWPQHKIEAYIDLAVLIASSRGGTGPSDDLAPILNALTVVK